MNITWFTYTSNSLSNKISNWSTHCKTRHIFILKPYSGRPYWITIRFSERIYSAIAFDDSIMLVFDVRLMISWKCLSYPNFRRIMRILRCQSLILTQGWTFRFHATYYCSWVSNIGTQQLLSSNHASYNCGAWIINIETSSSHIKACL